MISGECESKRCGLGMVLRAASRFPARSRRVSGSVIDAVWLDEELTELRRCVERGETLEVVSRLSAMVREPRYAVGEAPESAPVLEDTLH